MNAAFSAIGGNNGHNNYEFRDRRKLDVAKKMIYEDEARQALQGGYNQIGSSRA